MDPDPAGYTVKNTVIRSVLSGLSADLLGRNKGAGPWHQRSFRISSDRFGSCINGEGVLVTKPQKACQNRACLRKQCQYTTTCTTISKQLDNGGASACPESIGAANSAAVLSLSDKIGEPRVRLYPCILWLKN